MKRLLLPALLIIIFACENKHSDSEYEYRITWGLYLYDTWQDSMVYYYNDENKLLRVDKFNTRTSYQEYIVTYWPDSIINWNGTYYFDENNRAIVFTSLDSRTDYVYNEDFLIYQKKAVNDFIEEEIYYEYEDSNLIKDSTIFHHPNNENIYSIYRYTYTGTLNPGFIVDYSGLFEVPLKSRYLAKEAESLGSGVLYKYTYELSDNNIILHSESFDTFHNESGEIWTTRYTLINN